MRKRCCGVPLVLVAALNLSSCQTMWKTTPIPEAKQVISKELKTLYMDATAAPPQSAVRQNVLQRMAERAANGKELLLVMEAGLGPYPANSGARESRTESQVRSMVTAKMMQMATLDQLVVYAKEYAVYPGSARLLIQRMFQLADGDSEPGTWARISEVASMLGEDDLTQRAEAKTTQVARR